MKLVYFAVRGRVEPVRLMLELGGATYAFEGVPVETWRAGGKEGMLERTPFGQLPILEDGAMVVAQSQAILRHVARRLGLSGGSLAEQARVDEVSETALDVLTDMLGMGWDKSFEDKRASHREATATRLGRLESYFARSSPDGERWAVAGKLTAADAAMAFALECVLPLHPGLVEAYGRIHGAMSAFFAEPRVRAYVTSDRRPRTTTVPMATFGGKPEETHHHV